MERSHMVTDHNDRIESEHTSLIQASELSQYGYCHRAWWMGSVKKISPANRTQLARGRKLHTRHESWVQATIQWRRRGFLLIATGSLFFIIALYWLWLAG